MFQQLKNLFGGSKEDLRALVKQGAQVIDVRSREEFSGGHLKGSINIPLSDLPRQLIRIDKRKPIIVCCASGMRSGSAKQLLEAQGYKVVNGGGWTSLERKLNAD